MEQLINFDWGPVHTQAKSRDHKIVRAQKKCPKAVPRHFQNHVVWSRTLKFSVKPYVTGPSIHPGSSHMIKYNK